MLVYGGQQLYTWYRNRQITSLTYDDWVKKKPDADWIEMKGVYLDFTSSAVEQRKDKVESMYIAVVPQPPGLLAMKDPEPAKLLLHTTDPKYMALLNEINALTPAQTGAFVLKNADRIWPKVDLRGIMEFGVEASSKNRSQLEKLQSLKVAPDFAVLKDGAAPNLGLGAGLFGGGLLLGLVLIKRRNA